MHYHPIKNHSLFLEVSSLLKNEFKNKMKVIMVGKNINIENKQLMALIKNNDLEDCAILIDKTENINDYYNLIDCLLLTSKDESFPNVLCEAQLSGLKCLPNRCWSLYGN